MKVPEPRKLKSGTWFIQLRLDGVSVPVTASTAKECKHQAELIKAEHNTGKRAVERAKPTLSVAIDKYIEKRKNVLSPSTIDGYKRIQRNRFKGMMDEPITADGWQEAVNEEARDASPKTVRNAYRFIVSVLTENGIHGKRV